MKTVGVLGYDYSSFIDATHAMLGNDMEFASASRREVRTKDTRYLYLSKPEDLRGHTFDAVLLLEGYWKQSRNSECLSRLPLHMRAS